MGTERLSGKGKIALEYILIGVFIFLVASIAVFGYISYQGYAAHFSRDIEWQLSSVADMKSDEISQYIEDRLGDGKVLFKRHTFYEAVERYLDDPDDKQTVEFLRSWLSRYATNYQYNSIIVIDPRGLVRLAIPDTITKASSTILDTLPNILSSQSVKLSDFYRNDVDGRIYLSVLLPIIDEYGDGRPLGALVMRVDPETYIFPFIGKWPLSSKTAETMLVTRDGSNVLFLTKPRFSDKSALSLRVPLDKNRDMHAVKALLGQKGIVRGKDYRGVPVVAYVRPVAGSSWFMVAQIDESEAYQPMRHQLLAVVFLVLASAIVIGVVIWFIWRRRRLIFYEEQYVAAAELRAMEERLHFALEASHTGAWELDTTDLTAARSIEHDRIFGYSQLLPEWTYDMFLQHVLPEDRQMVDLNFRNAIEKKTDWRFECRIRRSDGAVRWIYAVGRHKSDSSGNITRMGGVVQDITERKEAEIALVQARELQYRTLIESLPGKVFLKDRDSVYVYCNDNYARDLRIKPEEIEGKTDLDLFPTHLAEKYRSDDKRIMESGITENIEEEYTVIKDFLRGAQRSIINTIKVPVRDKDGNVTGLFGFFWDITERRKAEEEVRDLNRQIEFILGATKTGLDIIDSDFNIVYIDPSWQKVYGGPPAGKKCYEYFMGKEEACPNCGIVKALETREPVVTEEVLEKEGGRMIQVTSIPFQDRDGNWLVAEVNIDITESKRLGAAIRESEARFRGMFEGVSDGIVVAGKEDMKFKMCNNAFLQMTGYSREEIGDLSIKDIHPEKDYPHIKELFGRLLRGDIKSVKDMRVKKKDGSIFYVDLNAVPVEVSGNSYMAGFFHDITEERSLKAERDIVIGWQKGVDSLQQSLLMPSALPDKLKMITDGIVRIFDADFCRIWLTKPGDMCDKGCIHAEVKEGPHVCRNRDKCLHLMASSGRYTHLDGKGHSRVPFGCYKIGLVASGEEHKFLTNDVTNDPRVHNHEWARELGLVSFAGYQLKIPSGDTIGVMALFAKHPMMPAEDAALDSLSSTISFVVQQSAAEEEKMRVLGFKTSSEIKSKFASMVSHELRSPLAVIKESINLILEELVGHVTSEQKDILGTAKNNIDRLGRLINNVLDFQKIESGKMALESGVYNINEIVLATSKDVNVLAENKGLSFTVNIDESIPALKFDKDKIVQVLINLLSNAIKFTQKGGVVVSTEREDNMVHVTVEDTGTGIRKDDMPKLFRTFEQVGDGLGKKMGGTGLGLAISKEIIHAHNGKLWAESVFEKGSKFHFILPIKERRG